MIEAIIFDWKRTLYDPESKDLIKGSLSVLQYIGSSGIKLYLVGKDPTREMRDEPARLGVSAYFEEIHFVADTKSDEDLGRYIDSNQPELTVVVGDRVRSEIAVGNRLGAQTVWVKQGKFALEKPETAEQTPDYTITDISELANFFDSIR